MVAIAEVVRTGGFALEASGLRDGHHQSRRRRSISSSPPSKVKVHSASKSSKKLKVATALRRIRAEQQSLESSDGRGRPAWNEILLNDAQAVIRKAALVAGGAGLAAGASWLYAGGGSGDWFGGNWGGHGGGGGGGGSNGSGPRRWRYGEALAVEDDDDEDEDEDDEDEDSDDEDEDAKDAGKKKPATVPAQEVFDAHGMRVGTRVPVSKLNPSRRYKIGDIAMEDLRTQQSVQRGNNFWDLLAGLSKNGVYTRNELEQEFEMLKGSGMFHDVNMEAEALENGTLKIDVKFQEAQWGGVTSVRVVNVGLIPQPPATTDPNVLEQQSKDRLRQARPTLLPKRIERELSAYASSAPQLTASMLQTIRDKIIKWYSDEGYLCANVMNFANLNTDEVVCEVTEGDVTGLNVVFLDRNMEKTDGVTNMKVIEREVPRELEKGMVFNMEATKRLLHRLNSLQLFANIEVFPVPDPDVDSGVKVELRLREQEPTTAEVNTEWSIAPGDTGKPTLVSAVPGGSVTFDHRNIDGLARSVTGTVSSGNLLNPQEDLDFRMEYRHPYVDGIDSPRNRLGAVSIFNNRKQAAVFVGGPNADEVPVVWVDRAGLKATITENLGKQSKFTYGVVMEEVTTRDENTIPCEQVRKIMPNQDLAERGPPTTHSGTATDRMAFLQANFTRDNTRFVNGTVIGERDIFQVDQGVFVGSKFPFFNRHQMSMTRFIQLKEENPDKKDELPWVGVLHGRYGGCVGDLPNYDAYAIGGPYSVRGYNMGEIGASRRFLELAAELRVPVQKTHAYVFGEYGTDLGGSKDITGNPTQYTGRVGHGGAVGVGVKLGQIRAEYIRDCNAGASSYFLRYGERF